MAGESVSRLTMQAEALGFEASAKAVDTLAAAQAKLTENQKALDGVKTGGSVEDVAKLISEREKLNAVVDGLGTVQDLHPRSWASGERSVPGAGH